MVVEFGQKAYSQINFANEESGKLVEAMIIDHHPNATEHFEGRRTVEVSIEMFVELMGAIGYRPISPEEAEQLRQTAKAFMAEQKETEQ